MIQNHTLTLNFVKKKLIDCLQYGARGVQVGDIEQANVYNLFQIRWNYIIFMEMWQIEWGVAQGQRPIL